MEKAFRWIAKNTANGSIAILPPWVGNGWYLTKRAQVACYNYSVFDHRFSEWFERVESTVGEVEADTTWQEMASHYNNLAEKEIDSIREKYGGKYLVSKGDYSYPALFYTGTYKVYLLETTFDKNLPVSKSMHKLSQKPESPLLK